MGFMGVLTPRGCALGFERMHTIGKFIQGRLDHQVGLVDAAKLLRIGVHMDQSLTRTGCLNQLVARGACVAQARADRHNQIGVLNAGCQRRAHPWAQGSHVQGVRVVKEILASKARANGQMKAFSKALDALQCAGVPVAAAQDQNGSFCVLQHRAQLIELALTRSHGGLFIGAQIGHLRFGIQQILR